MKKVFAFLMFAGVMALAACGSTDGGDGGDGGDGCGGSCNGGTDSGAMDTSDSTIDMYKNGTIKAQWWVNVHADAAKGQYWETSSEAYGTTTTQRWQVANVDGGTAIIEWQMKTDSQYAKSNYIIAFEVDLGVTTAGDVNVKKAWIGKPGEAGAEIQIMEKPEATCGGTASYEMTEEDFSGVNIAGKDWSGKLVTMKGEGWESKSWNAEGGYFGGVIKTEASGMVTELSAFGTDAEPLLKW